MYFGKIEKTDTANIVGIGVSLFVSGCRNHCEGCFNPETWNFHYGREFTEADMQDILKSAKPSYISGLSILGGDPMEQENLQGVLDVVKKFRETYPSKLIFVYTGYIFEDLVTQNLPQQIMGYIDVLIDGRYEEDKRNLSLPLRGSSNQRIIDIPKTLETNQVVLSKYQD